MPNDASLRTLALAAATSSWRAARASSEVAAAAAQEISLALFPHGGQGAARRNAWRALLEDRSSARDRAEAAVVLEEAAGHLPGDGPAEHRRTLVGSGRRG